MTGTVARVGSLAAIVICGITYGCRGCAELFHQITAQHHNLVRRYTIPGSANETYKSIPEANICDDTSNI